MSYRNTIVRETSLGRMSEELGLSLDGTLALSRFDAEEISRECLVTLPEIGRVAVFGAENILDPRDRGDSNHVNFWITPFAQGYGPSTTMRASAVKEGIGQADPSPAPLVVIAGNIAGQKNYKLTDAELGSLGTHGFFRPLARRIVKVARHMNAESVSLYGWSQGASVAASAADMVSSQHGPVRNLMIGESPNVMDRSPKQLQKDFVAAGLGALFKAQREGGVDIFRQIQGTHVLGIHRLAYDLSRFVASSKSGENAALHREMTHRTLSQMLDYNGRDRQDHAPGAVTQVRGENSTITPETLNLEELLPGRTKVQDITVRGYGHEIHDNLALLALIARDSTIAR